MRSHPQRLVCLILAATAAITTLGAAATRRLVVVLRPEADTAMVQTVLARGGLRLEPPLWADSGSVVRTAVVKSWNSAAAFDALGDLRVAGYSIGGGELLAKDGDTLRFYSGRVLVRFERPIDEPGARAWGRPLGLTLVRGARDATWFVFDAPLDPARVLALANNPPGGAVEVSPIVLSVKAPSPVRRQTDPAVYHRIPAERNKLVVLLEPGPDAAYKQFLADHHAIVISGATTNRQIVQFANEDAMNAAQADIGAVGSISRAGPLLSENPLAFLTNQIVVRFRNPVAVQQAGIVLDKHHVREARELSYVEDGFIYQVPHPSYALYDLGRELILGGYAVYAVPNVATFSESACHEVSCNDAISPANAHLEYLRMVKACAVRSASDVVLAILDEGIQATYSSLTNDRLRVETAIDFKTMAACHPPQVSNWWRTTGVCGPVFNPGSAAPAWTAGHGNDMALLAAADCDDDDLLGMAPTTPLINARRGDSGDGLDSWSDVAFADALWWLAGGNPAWCRDDTNYDCTGTPCTSSTPETCTEADLPLPLPAFHGAAVINLSFVREDFLEQACSDAATCRLVCANPAQCGVVDGVLERIRNPNTGDGVRVGGAVVVAAAGITGTSGSLLCYDPQGNLVTSTGNPHTDLAESQWTIAVGSVRTTGEPFFIHNGNQCLINHGGSFLDVVAPMGKAYRYCTSCGPGPLTSGSSSAATAVVSGIGTLMLEKNHGLTAAQAHCILRETANPNPLSISGPIWGPGSTISWKIPSFTFNSTGHSDRLGYGMVDAGAAVAAAEACTNPLSPACPCPPPPPPLNVHRTHFDTDWTALIEPVPAELNVLRACIESGECRCAPSKNCFLTASIRNQLRAYVPAATVGVCRGKDCRPLEGPPVDWATGGVLEVRIEMSPDYLRWARAQSGPLELRLFSGGKEVTKKMLANMRKGRGSDL